jgi:hypothetical protein
VDWSDVGSVSEFLRGLLGDCDRAFEVAQQAEVSGEEVDLLRKVIDQDIDRSDDQAPTIRKGVAEDRVPSVKDPEIRHGRKSSGKVYSGHKAHLAVEVTSGVITAVDMTAPGKTDGAHVKSLIEQTVESTGCKVDVALGDCAYSSREAQDQAQKVKIDLRTKMPSFRKDYFSPGDFEVSEDGQTALCPAGHESASQSTCQPKKSPRGIYHRWSEKKCSRCPLKSKCTSGRKRSLFVPPDFHERRGREQYARSHEGRQELRQRVVVEHAIGRIKNLGAGATRYFGRQKTRGQWWWTAAVANLSLVWGNSAVMGQ